MACWRYDPSVPGKWREIKPTELIKPDTGAHLSFKDQIKRGYQRQEAKGALINGRAKGIKNIWSTPMVPCRTQSAA